MITDHPDSAMLPTSSDELPRIDRSALVVLVAAKLAVHAVCLFRYGYFRDELYFLDGARHLDWGYVDYAPLVALYSKVALLLGGSLPALRVIPILAGAAVIALTVLIAREFGGGRFAQAVAGLSVLIAPIFLGVSSVLSMNVFEPLFWMGCALLLTRIVRTGDSRLWLWIGVLAGLGLENKHSTLFFGAALAVAVVLTPLRRELGRRWIWLGGGIALLLFLPNLLWQVVNGFPTFETLSNVREIGKNVVLPPAEFLVQQIFMLHPVTLLIWISGLMSLLIGRLSRYRVLGWIFLIFLAVMMNLHAKNYYLAPIYPMLMAAGGVAIEGWLSRWRFTENRWWPRAAVLAVLTIFGVPLVPMAVPLLPPSSLVSYQAAIGFEIPKVEVEHVGPLPQNFGDPPPTTARPAPSICSARSTICRKRCVPTRVTTSGVRTDSRATS
jgi:4-amino-4-deoxy-L-arabinose transferase-like glycosyltransferase